MVLCRWDSKGETKLLQLQEINLSGILRQAKGIIFHRAGNGNR